MKVIHKESDGETSSDNDGREDCVLEWSHIMRGMVSIQDVLIVIIGRNLVMNQSITVCEDFVQAIAAWMHLKRI